MIERVIASAVVVALPLIASAQAVTAPPARATWRTATPQMRAEDEAPLVRVWIPGAWSFRYGQPVPVSFEVSEAAHVAVLRVDANGRLMVLWPTNRNLQTAARAGQEYRISGPYSALAAFHADYEVGSGMVIAIASYDPIDLSSLRRYRNDHSYFRYVSFQRPYVGGVRHIVDRVAQEILYSPDTPYDYDVAFYNVNGRSLYSHAAYANCAYDSYYYNGGYRRLITFWQLGLPTFGYEDDDCYGNSFYRSYLAYCVSWAAFTNGYGLCRQWNPNWPTPPVTPQPSTPTVNIGMIDSIMARPVDRYPLLDRKTEQPTTTGTTHYVTMEPAREPPNVTRWIPEDDGAAISIPRLRGASEDRAGAGGGRIHTRDEGYRSPGTGIRTSDPRDGNRSPIASGGGYMPPVRQPPREPAVWRDNDRDDRGGGASPRWERPTSYEPRDNGVRSPAHTPASPSGQIDRGATSTGSSSPQSPASTGAKSDAGTSKASDSKSTGERKPHN